MTMSKEEKRVPSLHCDMCGRVFRPGDAPKCGALVCGNQWCDQDVLRRELDARLMRVTTTTKGTR
jgi:hypothetical protein